jgi:hypothetical protein
VSRSLEEILNTGAANSDERERVRAAGYTWKACRWCNVVAYTMQGLCLRCAEAGRTVKALL